MIANRLIKLFNSIQEKAISYLEGSRKSDSSPAREEIERVPLSADFVDLETLDEMEKGSSVEFYQTENSPFARDANKGVAHGIDKFDEEDTFEPKAE